MFARPDVKTITIALFAILLSSCGGGGDSGGLASSGAGNGGGSSGNTWTAGVYQPFATYAAKCATPRSGADPSGRTYQDIQGTVLDENNWLRSWSNHLYLWYRELPDLNPANYSSTAAYFALLKTSATTSSGKPKDQFHFTYPTSVWEALSNNAVESGYGARWAILPATSGTPARLIVAYIEPNSALPAAQAGLARGAEVLTVDGQDLASTFSQAQADIVNEGIYPDVPGESHAFRVRDLNGTVRTFNMQSSAVTTATVQNVRTFNDGLGTVGYLQFNAHVGPAEDALFTAVQTLTQANVNDLIIDLRYNGGGSLAIASELAYMIAGAVPTAGRTFERSIFNDKHTATNPVTGQAWQPIPFYSSTRGASRPVGQALPTLNLQRVFVLTAEGTCSASESVMNGLRGVDVEVIQIGSTTCGKPYGFYPQDNCGTTYFSIQLQTANAKDFGSYADGFSPNNTQGAAGVRIPGCSVADDFSHPLGDAAESMLAAALNYRLGASCPAPSGRGLSGLGKTRQPGEPQALPDLLQRPFWRENRIIDGI